MPDRRVVNASPLIVLAKINPQHLLSELADEIIIPQAVFDEVWAGPENDPARQYLITTPYPDGVTAVSPLISAWDLGAGETGVLSYAYQNTVGEPYSTRGQHVAALTLFQFHCSVH